MRMLLKIAVTAAAICGASGAASAATIVNGSFELGTNPGTFMTLHGGSTAITGWSVGADAGGIDYIGSYWQAADGARSIDLAGNGRGSIYQDVATVVGQLYSLTFFLAGNPDGGSLTKLAVTSIGGGDTEGFAFMNVPGVTTRQNMGWTQFTYNFVAGGTTSRITFASANSRTSPYGPALDNVAISAVPEPASWAMMLLGFGVLGFALRQRGHGRPTIKVKFA